MIDKILQYFKTLNLANPVLMYAQLFLAVIFIVSTYFFISYLVNHHWFSMKFAKLKDDIDEQRRLREEEYKQRFLLEGETEQDTVLLRLDNLILDAGLKDKYPELNAENFLLLVIGISIVTGILSGIWMHNFLAGLMGMILPVIVIICYLEIKAIRNYIKIENQLLKFINYLDNVSSIENTIGEMLGRVSVYLSDPLKIPVEQCYYEIKAGVPADDALKKLSTRINYKKFRNIINSLRVCAAHNENYAEVIEESKADIKRYISFKRQIRNIRRNMLFELGVIFIAGVAILGVLSFIVDNVFSIMTGTLIGQIVLAYLVLVIAFGVISTLRKERK